MAGILCSCKVPWRIAILDGKSVELCPVCGAWRESEWQVEAGLWQGETDFYPKGQFEVPLPTRGGDRSTDLPPKSRGVGSHASDLILLAIVFLMVAGVLCFVGLVVTLMGGG